MANQEGPKLLWNPESVKDVAESIGINLADEPLRLLTQDVEYRVGQVIVEAVRFMRAANRTTMTTQDVTQALKVLDVEPLYGYQSTRPLRYGEASLGPGQPLYFIDDEEVDFEKLINAPLPKVPRDMSFTAHWLAIEGVQPIIPQNPTPADTSSKDLLPKGPGANPALAALAGNDNVSFRPAVKHVISKELALHFDKIQTALLDDSPEDEKTKLRAAALESVRADPGLHQLVPYFVSMITHHVTHRLNDLFVLKGMMELVEALIQNPNVFLDPYASSLSAPVLTCMMGRNVGGANEGTDGFLDQYRLRELAASLIGKISQKFGSKIAHLRPKLTKTCLKQFLDPNKTPAVWYGAINGLSAAGGPEVVRMILLPNLKAWDDSILKPLREKGELSNLEFEVLVGTIMKAINTLASGVADLSGGSNGLDMVREGAQVIDFLGSTIGERVAVLQNHGLNKEILSVQHLI